MHDIQFRKLLNHFNLSWDGYRKVRKGVKKRISRHMQRLGSQDIEKYLEILSNNLDARLECERLLTVSISRFFRDKKLWETLLQIILPDIAGVNDATIRVWSAGCASGEEAYSLKILWESFGLDNSLSREFEITATDINPQYIKRAKAGVYNLSSLKEVPENLFSKYFRKLPGKKFFRIDPLLQKDIIWLEQDLFFYHPLGPFHMIFFRNNILTYYNEEATIPVIIKVMNSLHPGGYLIIGSHEKLPNLFDKQFQVGPLSFVYKKI